MYLRAIEMPAASSLGADGVGYIIAASEVILDREPARLASARQAMQLLRVRLTMEGAQFESLDLINRYIAHLDLHIRRGRKTRLKLVSNQI